MQYTDWRPLLPTVLRFCVCTCKSQHVTRRTSHTFAYASNRNNCKLFNTASSAGSQISNSSVSEDAGSNPGLLWLWHWQPDALATLDLIHIRLDLVHSRRDLIQLFLGNPTIKPPPVSHRMNLCSFMVCWCITFRYCPNNINITSLFFLGYSSMFSAVYG
jgi:hypothetical protein